MTLSLWMLLGIVLAAGALCGSAGFLLGRKTGHDSKRIAALEADLAAQRNTLESVNTGINSHFEESAKLFGQLAQDYRAFFEHFTDSAAQLGLSARRAEQIRVEVETQLLPNNSRNEQATAQDDEAMIASADGNVGDNSKRESSG
ncbi:MAG: DUF1043 family protein [Gammaproteobacteria bacterium]|nr:DUF1043 family protein [Gammaproteobacteria bacterium]